MDKETIKITDLGSLWSIYRLFIVIAGESSPISLSWFGRRKATVLIRSVVKPCMHVLAVDKIVVFRNGPGTTIELRFVSFYGTQTSKYLNIFSSVTDRGGSLRIGAQPLTP